MIQEILTLVRKHMRLLTQQHPLGFELIERQDAPGSFPFSRLLEKDAEVMLMRQVASEIIATKLGDWVPQEHISGGLPECVQSYVIDKDAKEELLSELKMIPPPILLLKGLIGHGIIAFVLREKRWRVDYGLRHNFNLAVPYRAKDSPVPRAQFAHPDIKIALTCMSYYYQGLEESQLRICFRHLKGFIDPDMEYADWIMECETYLPPPLRHLNGVNLEDAHQWSHTLYPLLKMTKKVIDFYLSQIVFPSRCQEFPAKLSTSTWDLAEERKHLTTGFSGTSDTRYLLPISIEQLDLDTQAHTNAKVLRDLLRPENRFYECIQTPDGKRLSAREILQKMVNLQDRLMGQIQVLVDVGAQVLDMDNEEVARCWLLAAAQVDSKWTAALYFDVNGELTVIGKDNRTQPYISSPYLENMESCLVYLDEAHTRGTDIKLPANSVAAVTLGTKLTKDKLVQACMRMRSLGYGQSVCFFAPPEVHRRILYHCMKTDHEPNQGKQVETIDVLYWVMRESVIQIQENFPLWANQGIDYQMRQGIALRSRSMWKTNINYKQFTAAWKKAEFKTLTEMYSTGSRDSNSMKCIIDRKVHDVGLRERRKELLAIRLRCEEYQITQIPGLSLQELRECEVLRETIQEHSPVFESRPRVQPYTHKLHPSLATFINTGVSPPDSGTLGSPFYSLMDTLRQTSFSNNIETERWAPNILTTRDFAFAVKSLRCHWYSMPKFKDLQTDLYLRPVTWILSTGAMRDGRLTLIILSPFEVNELLPQIRKSKFVNLHMYSAKVKRLTPNFYDLTSLAIPTIPDKQRWQSMYPEKDRLMVQINLYAGELFFGSYEVYRKTNEFLGICVGEGETPTLHPVGCQGFRRMVGCQAGKGAFQSNQLKFLKYLVEARRGMNIDHTHMDCLLRWRLLQAKDWKVGEANFGHEELSDTEDASEEESLGGSDIVDSGKCRRCGQDVLTWE